MIAVFLGPTLPVADARAELDALYLGPAAQGDVLRAVRHGATAIGLIDGLFHRVPSVWHKEVLWAISEGVPVYGAASMGALRAAELSAFGMVGVGDVFEAYASATITDDDEVALTHAGGEHEYRPSSEPLVDIRATLARAEEARVIGRATRSVLVCAAKALHYADRSYRAIIHGARGQVPDDELSAFAAWWPDHRVSQKREDAIALLRRLRYDSEHGTWPQPAPFVFERTALFEDLVRRADGTAFGGTPSVRAMAEEQSVALARAAIGSARDGALARVLCLDEARRQQYQVDEDTLYDIVIQFRLERGLLEPDDLERWIAENHLDRVGFLRLMRDEARIAWVRAILEPEIDAMLPDYLRVSGQFDGATDCRAAENA